MFGIARIIKLYFAIKEENRKAESAKALAEEHQRKCEEAYNREQYQRSLIHF